MYIENDEKSLYRVKKIEGKQQHKHTHLHGNMYSCLIFFIIFCTKKEYDEIWNWWTGYRPVPKMISIYPVCL